MRPNIGPPYSLHDMNIIDFEAEEDKLTLRSRSGMVTDTPLTDTLSSTAFSEIFAAFICWALREMKVPSQAKKCF